MLRGPSWSEIEVEAIVADYFSMLEKELRGIPYSKTDHRRALSRLLSNRTDGSIERKHQNISAVLMETGFPYVRGYKPLSQYQGLLADVVLEHLEEDAVLATLALSFAEAAVAPPRIDDVLAIMTTPPAVLGAVRAALADQPQLRRARKIDYLAREARNRTLGTNGEALVVSYERKRLSALGHYTLADRVEHVSLTQGDGLGYDVLSFSSEGRERFIEVKTTQLGPLTPFYLTSSEIGFSTEHTNDYSLYRLYEFATSPRMFTLNGPLNQTCSMKPTQYVALPR